MYQPSMWLSLPVLTHYPSFDENYGLASTQSLKNKDIPEGGAKGTILPSYVAHRGSPGNRH